MTISNGGKFGDKRPVRETRTRSTGQPKGIEVRVGVFRIVRGRDDWVILAKGGVFVRVADLLQEAEKWARGETRRLAGVETARQDKAYADERMRKAELGWVDEGITAEDYAAELLEQRD